MNLEIFMEHVREAVASRNYMTREDLINIVFTRLDTALQTLTDEGEIFIRPGPPGEPHLDIISRHELLWDWPRPVVKTRAPLP